MNSLYSQFEVISLEELNNKARLMTRRDSKYILSTAQLNEFLCEIKNQFLILEIQGVRQFEYHTLYMDTKNLKCFKDHNQGRRRRFKLRFRHYVDSSLYYLELKIKGRRNLTHKYRLQINSECYNQASMSSELKNFVKETIEKNYQYQLDLFYEKSLMVKYKRITLVSKIGEEHITIDNKVCFSNDVKSVEAKSDLWVIEIKSRTGNSCFDKSLYKNKTRPVSGCSKYCVGINLLNSQVSRFTPVVKKFVSR